MEKHIFVIEDVPVILESIVRAVNRDPRLRATGFGTVDEAVGKLKTDPPDLLITDLNLPGRHGIEMITELDKAGIYVPVIVITAYRAAYEQYFPKNREIPVLEKPVQPAAVIEQVHAQLATAPTEPLGPNFQVADYLQLAAMGRYSVSLRVSADEGEEEGLLEIVEGDVWNAYFGGLVGEDAVAALLDRTAAAVASRALATRPKRRQIDRNMAGLILDLARKRDEAIRDLAAAASEEPSPAPEAPEEPSPAPEAPEEPTPPASEEPMPPAPEIPEEPTPPAPEAPTYARAFEQGMEATRREDWERATAAFEQALALRPGDGRAQYNLTRIAELKKNAAGDG